MDTVSFDQDQSIYGISDPVYIWTGKNEPASYIKHRFEYINGSFSHYYDIESDVDAYVDAEGGNGYLTNINVTFHTGHCTASSSHRSTELLPDEITELSRTLNWKYRVPDGSNNWIYMQDNPTGPHTIYTVYNTRKCDYSDYTKEHINYATTWAAGGVLVTENDIPHLIQHALPVNFQMGIILSDPWDIVDNGASAECSTHARLMAEALKVLGINAGMDRVGETRFCIWHGTEWHTFLETGSLAIPTNFEGVCSVNLIDETSPWTCYYDIAMGEVQGDMQKGNHTNMWTEWHSMPPPHHKVIFSYQYWENHLTP